MRVAFLLLLAIGLAPASLSAKDLRILVSGIDPAQGQIHCLLFKEARGFPGSLDRAFAKVEYPASGEMLTCTFIDVAPGRYAVSVLHDADGDGEFEGEFEDEPGEPWGVTNNVRPGDRAPDFVEAVIYMGSLADYEVALRR
jgi:uncharacterized protein (DUF2141 family)